MKIILRWLCVELMTILLIEFHVNISAGKLFQFNCNRRAGYTFVVKTKLNFEHGRHDCDIQKL